MRLLGQILLWGGFLAGSLLTVLNAPMEGVEYTRGLQAKMKKTELSIAKQQAILDSPEFQSALPEEISKAKVELSNLESEFDSAKNIDSILKAKGSSLQQLTELDLPENGWHLIPWIPYGVAALVCFAGVVLLHVSKANAIQKPEDTAASLSEIKSALASAIQNASALSQQSAKMAPSKIVVRIDEEIAEHLRVFADGRDCMTTEYGLNVFADVMSPFAAGERAINRAWSASADGYIDEATDCLKRGCDMLIAAQTELENAGKQ